MGRREAALARVSEREERLFGRRGKEERKAGEREGCFLSERVCVCVSLRNRERGWRVLS